MQMPDEPKPPGVPPATRDAMQAFSNDIDELHTLQRLCIAGMAALRAMPGVVRTLVNSPADSAATNEQRLEDARRTADLAKNEHDKDFPLLRALVTIAVWSHLEGHFKTLLTHCVQHELLADHQLLRRIKVRVGEWYQLNDDERPAFVLSKIEQTLSAAQKAGVGRFESILEACGLSGPVPPGLRRDVLELSAVRNSLVHSNRTADIRLAKQCPWLSISPGEPVHVTQPMLDRYFSAAIGYVCVVHARIAARYGVDVSDIMEKANLS
jgi:hypothetical protein